jgi:hypothetical protein
MNVIADVFKVYSRKSGFSIFITSQYYFEGGKQGVIMRNNSSHILALQNVVQPNYTITKNPDLNRQFREATRFAYKRPYGYVVVIFRANVDDKFRVCTNLFRENEEIPFPIFFT